MAKKIRKTSRRELEKEARENTNGPNDMDVHDADDVIHGDLLDQVNDDSENDEIDAEMVTAFYLRQIYAQLKRVADSLEKLADASDSKL